MPVQEITVGVVAPAYVNVPLWAAQRRGILERYGLRAVSVVVGSTEGVTSAVRAGNVDVALSSPEGTIADAVAGGPLRVVAGLVDRPPLSLIALGKHRDFGDLRGGRIGTSSLKEGTRHIAERMLAAHGLTYPADYEFALEGSHVARWQALRAGTIDAALQMVPYDYLAEEAGFTNLGAVSEDFAFHGACARVDADREVVTGFLLALAEGTRWFLGNVAESAALAADETSMAERHALRACRALAGRGVLTADLKFGRAALEAMTGSLRASGGLPEGTDARAAAALDYSCLEAA